LVAAMIVLSYLPVDSCHAGSQVKTDCGQLFHCPVLFGGSLLESLELPRVGTLRSFKWVKAVEGFESPVFRPPKKAFQGDGEIFFLSLALPGPKYRVIPDKIRASPHLHRGPRLLH